MANVLYSHISSSRSICAELSTAVFCIPLISCFTGMFLRYFLRDFKMVPVAPIVTGITFVFTFQMRYISILKSSVL